MAIKDALLPEFDHEMHSTRTVLERVPEDKATWSPHPKSFNLGDLATHVANLPLWATMTMGGSEFDVNPPDGKGVERAKFSTKDEMLKAFDEKVAAARAAIDGASDEDLMGMWTLKNGGEPVFSMPRVSVLRAMVFNHIIHHRGQLTVYLRLNDVPLPPLYGPTADEGMPAPEPSRTEGAQTEEAAA